MKLRKRRQYLNRTLNPLGRRCSTFQPGCFCCESYRYFDIHGRFPTFDEADALASAGMKLYEADFQRRAAAAIDRTVATGNGVPADVVIAKLQKKLDAARGKKST